MATITQSQKDSLNAASKALGESAKALTQKYGTSGTVNLSTGAYSPQSSGQSYSAPAPQITSYVVPQYNSRTGEGTLSGIASKFGVSINDLLKANPSVTNPDFIRTGQSINIPGVSGISGATAPRPTPTTSFGADLMASTNQAIPSSALSRPSDYSSVATKRSDFESQLNKLLSQKNQANNTVASLSTPGGRETEISNRLRELDTQLNQGLVTLEGETIPTPLIGGQQDVLKRQVAFQQLPLTNELTALTDARKAGLEAARFQAQNIGDTINTLAQIQKLTRPDIVGSPQIDEKGNVYFFVQNPDGTISQQYGGNVPGSGKEYIQTAIKEDANGNNVFYGIKKDGTVEVKQLGGGGDRGGKNNRFTKTQLNKGAAIAGLDIEDFSILDDDTKNFFINTTQTALQKKIDNLIIKPLSSRESSPEELKSLIDESELQEGVKVYLKEKVDNEAKKVGPSWFDTVKSFFGY